MKTFTKLLTLLLGTIALAVFAQQPQIHIKVRFFEVPEERLVALQKISQVASDGTEMLSPSQKDTLLQEFQSGFNVRSLAEPEVVTTSGRQTRMQATQMTMVITNFSLQNSSSNNPGQTAISPQSGKFECGPKVDIVPTVSGDGLKIKLETTISDKKFVGYADPVKPPSQSLTKSEINEISLPTISPVFQVSQATAQSLVADGWALVLFPKAEAQQDQRLAEHIALAEQKNGKKFLVVLITPTIVDAAGNRIHPN